MRDYEGLLVVHIETYGGHVDLSPTGDHTIEVSDAEPRSMSDKRQLYSAKFITESVAGNKLLNLNHYLCNLSSNYKKTFDANEILRRETAWSQVAHLKHTQNHVTYEETEDMALLRYVIENHKSFGTGPSRTKFYADMHKIFKTRSENAIKHRIESVMLPNLRLYLHDPRGQSKNPRGPHIQAEETQFRICKH